MPPLLPTLRDHVRTHAENRPGVYRLHGPGEELLYVGKSVRVRTRLLSYFRADSGEKPGEVIRRTVRIEWEHVPNEFEALLTEMRLIQRHRPPYNVQHKRKRAYTFVKVTREPAPRVVAVARPTADGAAYFGPFPRVGAVTDAIRDLAYVLGLRDCPGSTPVFFDDQLELLGGRPGHGGPDGGGDRMPLCMRADLGTCLAPCCGRTSEAEYRRGVRDAMRFLEGRGRAPLRALERRMATAVREMEFEYAAVLRDRAERLERFQEEMAAWRGRVASLTFAYRVPGFGGGDRLYLLRNGLVRERLAYPKSEEARARSVERVERVYAGSPPAPDALTPEEAAEILLVARWFRLRPREMERTRPADAWLNPRGPSAGSSRTPPARPAGPTADCC